MKRVYALLFACLLIALCVVPLAVSADADYSKYSVTQAETDFTRAYGGFEKTVVSSGGQVYIWYFPAMHSPYSPNSNLQFRYAVKSVTANGYALKSLFGDDDASEKMLVSTVCYRYNDGAYMGNYLADDFSVLYTSIVVDDTDALEQEEKGFWEKMLSYLKASADRLQNMDTIVTIEQFLFHQLKDELKDVLTFVFVPSEDYVTAKIDTLCEEFSFADSIIRTWDKIVDVFETSTGTPPKIEIDFGNAESKYGYDYGGKAFALDMSWYARYKGTVDTIAGAFIVGAYVWRLRHNLPNIISGVGSSVNTTNSVSVVPYDKKGGF